VKIYHVIQTKFNQLVWENECPHDHQPTDKGYSSDIRVTKTSKSFTHKMAAKPVNQLAYIWNETTSVSPYRYMRSARCGLSQHVATQRGLGVTSVVHFYRTDYATEIIIRPHRMHRTDAAYCYRRRTFRGLCVCMCWAHRWACKTAEQIETPLGRQTRVCPLTNCPESLLKAIMFSDYVQYIFKTCSLSTMLAAKWFLKVILPTVTSPECQRDAE